MTVREEFKEDSYRIEGFPSCVKGVNRTTYVGGVAINKKTYISVESLEDASIISSLERMLLHSLIEQVYNGSEETRREAMDGFATEDHEVMMKLMERFSREIDEA